MSTDFAFRRRAVRSLTNLVGVYALCDLDKVPIYVGQSTDGIRARVARHLTSARSDIIANRQIDVWEIAWVMAFPVSDRWQISVTEAALFHKFHPISQLMNGSIPVRPGSRARAPEPTQIVQVMSDKEIAERRDPVQRLPRQAGHYTQMVAHYLAVKNSTQIARAMNAHFARLSKYHNLLLGMESCSED